MKSVAKRLFEERKSAKASSLRARRFVILGLPRSGSTYLMTLLNAHRDIFCSGEQFNPYAVVGIEQREESYEAILQRDSAPEAFMEGFFADAGAQGHAWVGFKFMIGHNIRTFQSLAAQPDLTLVHVWRENKLAQVSSLIKAANSRNWAQTQADAHIDEKIQANPRQISHRWHEYAMFDELFGQWFSAQPHRKISLEYKEMFQPDFEKRICKFLSVKHDPDMKSPLVKQGANTILERFENPGKIATYFRQLGLEHWLEPEL